MDSLKTQKNLDLFYFNKFRLDARENRLWYGEDLVPLTPKEFEVLFYLVKNAGKVAEKNDLLDAVWAETYVEETTLARNVSWLRQKLAEFSDDSLIETVPKRGYCFAAEVKQSVQKQDFLIIEEQTIQHLRSEETITIGDENLTKHLPRDDELAFPIQKSKSTNQKLISFAYLLITIIVIGYIVYQNYFQRFESKDIVATNIFPFSGTIGNEDNPGFSPDGNRIVYSWNGGTGNVNDIYARTVAPGTPIRLTDNELNDRYPTFSPDGSEIAFIRESKTFGELMVINSNGGEERRIRRLFSGNFSISYAPDKKTIAVIDTENSFEGGQYAVYLVDTQTYERKRLTAPSDFLGETTPRFSPDGKNLAFVRIYDGIKQDLFVVPAGGGEPRQITFDGVVIHSLSWGADGKMIYFVSFRASNQPRLWVVPADGGEPKIIAIGGNNVSNIAISPDGKKLAFVESSLQSSIWRVNSDGQTAKKFITSNGNNIQPRFFPDGSQFLFKSNRTGNYDIWKADISGNNLSQITQPPTKVHFPNLSPDGSLIAFHGRIGEIEGIYVMKSEGGEPKLITNELAHFQYDRNYALFPTWSSDSNWIFFTSKRSGENQIWKVRADTAGEAIQITRNGGFHPAAAPDGKTVFFTKSENAKEMWRVAVDGSFEEIVPEFSAAGFDENLGWTTTPKGIYFFARKSDGSIAIKLFHFVEQKISEIQGNYKIPQNLNFRFGMTTNGNEFLFSVQDPQINYIMLADLPK